MVDKSQGSQASFKGLSSYKLTFLPYWVLDAVTQHAGINWDNINRIYSYIPSHPLLKPPKQARSVPKYKNLILNHLPKYPTKNPAKFEKGPSYAKYWSCILQVSTWQWWLQMWVLWMDNGVETVEMQVSGLFESELRAGRHQQRGEWLGKKKITKSRQ